MIRVYVLSLFLAVLLTGCATEQAQAPVAPPLRINTVQQKATAEPDKEDISECSRKTSIMGAWDCFTKDRPPQ
jgi:uncharacterized lipoprotein YbaY